LGKAKKKKKKRNKRVARSKKSAAKKNKPVAGHRRTKSPNWRRSTKKRGYRGEEWLENCRRKKKGAPGNNSSHDLRKKGEYREKLTLGRKRRSNQTIHSTGTICRENRSGRL